MERVFSQTFGVVGAIIERDGRFLLVKESQAGRPDHGKWSHPAGWIDVGEDPREAVAREVREETGFRFTPTHLLGVYSLVRRDLAEHLGATPHAIKLLFMGTISDDQTTELGDDVSEVSWFTPEQIHSMDSATLRDSDIKQMVRDYVAGRRYPLESLRHTVA
jgi:ADP-ribose pyrophosphatase YjhB (NUDIX family)